MWILSQIQNSPYLKPFWILGLYISLNFIALVQAGGIDEDYEQGEELYDLSCANCHGKQMNNPGTSSFNLKDFPKDAKQRFINSVSKGKGFMPSFGKIFDEEEIEQLWIYISRTEN